MYKNGNRSFIQADINRSYMKALRDLLGLKQYSLLRLMDDARIIRESQVSVIEGKVGLDYLWPVYADYMRALIGAEKDQPKDIIVIMMMLLKKWEES